MSFQKFYDPSSLVLTVGVAGIAFSMMAGSSAVSRPVGFILRFVGSHPLLKNCVLLAVMIMESFDRLSRKDKYVWDVSHFLYFVVPAIANVSRRYTVM